MYITKINSMIYDNDLNLINVSLRCGIISLSQLTGEQNDDSRTVQNKKSIP